MDKPRIIFIVDENLKHKSQMKAMKEKRTLTDVLIELLTRWVKKP